MQEIKTLEEVNKCKPTHQTSIDLMKLRISLRDLQLYQYEKHVKSVRANFYVLNNKAGAFLTKRFKGNRTSHKIPLMLDKASGSRISSPKGIAELFKNYYSTLYDLKADTQTPQPPTDQIHSLKEMLQAVITTIPKPDKDTSL